MVERKMMVVEAYWESPTDKGAWVTLTWRQKEAFCQSECVSGIETEKTSCKVLDLEEGQYTRYRPTDHIGQGFPTPGLQTSTGPQPVRNWSPQQEVSSRWANKLHFLLPIAHITTWPLFPVRSVVALDFGSGASPPVNCAWEGSRLCAP